MKFKKSDIVSGVVQRMREDHRIAITRDAAEKAVDCAFAYILDALADGNDVMVSGFGSFKLQDVKSRPGRNVSKGETVTIPARRKARFVPGKEFKERVQKDLE